MILRCILDVVSVHRLFVMTFSLLCVKGFFKLQTSSKNNCVSVIVQITQCFSHRNSAMSSG